MTLKTCAKAAVYALVLLAGLSSSARATVIVQNITLSATPNTDMNGLNPVAGLSLHVRGWNLAGLFTPFSLTSGDTLQVNLTFTSPVSIVDNNPSFALGNLQSSSVGFSNGLANPGFTSTLSTTATFTGTTGDFVGNPAINTVTGMGPMEGIGAGIGAPNLTNSTMSFTGVTFNIDVLSIPAQGALFQFGSFNIGDQLNPIPAPGALALLGFGLFGIGGLRRKKNAA